MSTFVIGDIHGGLKALKQLFERAAVLEGDTLVFLGDYVDGWSESPQVLDFLINLQDHYPCIFLRGNHDELLLHWLQRKHDNPMWLSHGGASSVKAYQSISEKKIETHIAFLLALKDYYLDDHNRLFIHAGFTNLKGITHEHYPRLFYWDRTLWETALSLDERLPMDSPLYPRRLKLYTEIYIGHTSVSLIGETKPTQKATVWNIDTGAAFKGPLTILNIDTKEFWQSDPVFQLYPDENGRN